MYISTEARQKIFNYFSSEHDVVLMESDFWELEKILSEKKAIEPDEDDLMEGGTGGCRD